jgi:hypothetical protein
MLVSWEKEEKVVDVSGKLKVPTHTLEPTTFDGTIYPRNHFTLLGFHEKILNLSL